MSSDDFDLDDEIGISDQHNRMVDAVLNAFIDAGGNSEDVRCFVIRMRDAGTRERRLLTSFVRNILNEQLWNIAKQRVSIGSIDYRPTIDEFIKKARLMTRIEHPQRETHADQILSGNFTYSLAHESRYEALWTIAKKYANQGVPVADWRELLMYGVYLQSQKIDLGEYEIFAFGSSFQVKKNAPSFPRLRMVQGPDWRRVSLVWESLKDFRAISRRRFYLVRQ